MRLATQVYILFPALCLMCMTNCSAEENGGCQEGSQSRIYQGSTRVYQYGVRVQSDLQCAAPQGVQGDSSRDKSIKENATQRETGNLSPQNKEEKMRGLLETTFHNRSRPIAWLDDYNVSIWNIFVWARIKYCKHGFDIAICE